MTKWQPFFTADEDIAIWRFAIEHPIGNDFYRMWKPFVEQMNPKMGTKTVCCRFHDHLLPNLPHTTFHTETKLKLCVRYKFQVDDEFLSELEKDAIVALDKNGVVIAYKMRPSAGRNIDLELDKQSFLIMSSATINKEEFKFSSEEDAKIWEYVAENWKNPDRGTEKFWKELIWVQKWNRTTKYLVPRFTHILAPKLHEMTFDMETKLKLYKAYEIPVDLKFLETLKRRYDLKIDPRGCIYWYQRKCDRKRKALWKSYHHDHTYHQLADDTDEDDVDDDVVEIQNQNQSSVTPEPPEYSFGEVKMEPNDDEDVPMEFTNFLNFQQPNLYQNSSEMTQILQGIIGTAAEQMRNEMTKMMEIVAGNMTHFDKKITKLTKNLEESIKNEISEVAETVGTLKDDMEIIKHQMLLEPSNLFTGK